MAVMNSRMRFEAYISCLYLYPKLNTWFFYQFTKVAPHKISCYAVVSCLSNFHSRNKLPMQWNIPLIHTADNFVTDILKLNL